MTNDDEYRVAALLLLLLLHMLYFVWRIFS